MKGLYKVFEYNEKQKKEIEYLVDVIDTLQIQDEVQEALFQFSPRLLKKNNLKYTNHESWVSFHKNILLEEIILGLLESIIENEYILEFEMNEQINNKKFKDFFKNDLKDLSKKQIIDNFREFYQVQQ